VSATRVRYHVSGVVQGVGFRPFVYVTATGLGLCGSVSNDPYGVVVDVEGERAAVRELGRRLAADAPPLAVVAAVTATELAPAGHRGFRIAGSLRAADPGVRTQASPDVATCADCLRELADPADRRYRHPFISCTNCGPRWTIIRDLPYDRPATTMAGFALCGACAAEYADPADRRFHAQPIACHDCGPRLELVRPGAAALQREDALVAARRMLADGAVVAVKGLGGYHLACDAGNPDAVALLRARKRRGDKPFAVMAPDLGAARRIARIDATEAALLTGRRRPVVLLRREPGAGQPTRLAAAVAPGSPDLGVLLPYTPVHTLLLEPAAGGPELLVMTSGNLGGEPIAYDDGDALERLAPLVDAWLRHDRPIQVPVDDSVTRVVDGVEAPVRRSRGYAPLSVPLPVSVPPTLAAGADLKNTCAVGAGRRAWLSQHIGDVDDLATLAALGDCAGQLERLVGVAAQHLAADAHPGYRSTGWARRAAAGRQVRLVQHHHAHIAAVMGEHGVGAGEQVIGIAFDGTGYGTDGAVWGGEVLVAGYRGFRRAAHLRYVPLPGSDAAVARPYRMALAHLHAAGVPWDADLPPVAACPQVELGVLAHQVRTGFGSVPTSSMGRLFDAVSSILGVRHTVDYEAQAAIELEGLARAVEATPAAYRFDLVEDANGTLVADAAPLVRALVAAWRAGEPVAVLAAAFHESVAVLVRDLAERIRAGTGLDVVCLGGGVFGNALLHARVRTSLRTRGFRVLSAEQVPANDGGIALGQLLVSGQLAEPVERRG
jgi:hydrogenase maturation protein HypF